MAKISVAKTPRPETAELDRWFGFDVPLFHGSLFNLIKHFEGEMDEMPGRWPRTAGNGFAWTPAIEVKEKEGKFFVTADLPGLKKEDVTVHVEGDTLVVEGERKREKEEKRDGYYRSERSYGKFYRLIPLPEGAVIDKTAANFNNGVLEVIVPIPVAKTARKEIPVGEESKKAA
jgi:HSP20 family molecular chaperone IbpA